MSFEITRRDFLLVNLASSLAVLAQPRAALALTDRERRTLLAAARTLFPHNGVADAAYFGAVGRIAHRCNDDSKAFDDVVYGVAALEWACGGQFATAGERARVGLLHQMRGSRFFSLVYRETLEGLYGSAHMWNLFLADGRATTIGASQKRTATR